MKYATEEAFVGANAFGKGAANTAYAQYFVGNSYLNPLTDPQITALHLSNVTFEPGCRNNWHIHHATKGGGSQRDGVPGHHYLGYGRALPFLHATNDALTAAGVALPLPGQATTTMNDRLEKGIAAQVKIFGEHMNEAWKAGTVNRYLAANCFGDYYTRTGLNLAQREMITFCFLSAQGGCEPQLIAHAKGNMNMGNDAAFLTKVVLQCLPYIGYPRSLNAIGCIAKAAKQ